MMDFSMSAMLATQFMLRVVAGKVEGVPRPAWLNFTFFYAIKPGRIRKVQRIEPHDGQPGGWVVEREYTFFLLTTAVAYVTMQGLRVDGGGKGDADTSWTQSRIRYASSFDISGGWGIAEEWRDVSIPVIAYTSFLMPSHVGAI